MQDLKKGEYHLRIVTKYFPILALAYFFIRWNKTNHTHAKIFHQLQMMISSDVCVIQELNFLYNIPLWDCPTCDLMVVSEKTKQNRTNTKIKIFNQFKYQYSKTILSLNHSNKIKFRMHSSQKIITSEYFFCKRYLNPFKFFSLYILG